MPPTRCTAVRRKAGSQSPPGRRDGHGNVSAAVSSLPEKEMKKALERKSRRAAPGEEASPSRESPRSPVKYNVSPPGTGTA